LLTFAGIMPNKRLGQHFLTDLNLMRLLIDSAHICHEDVVLEVGSGTGSLTEALAELAGSVIAVELDRPLAEITRQQLAAAANVEVINTDVLENKNKIAKSVTDAVQQAGDRFSGRFLLVANLPYNAAAPVMLNLTTGPVAADCMYVTVQKEVAARMTAAPGSRDYGIISIILAAMGDTKILRTLRPSAFWPEPQVTSTMLSFTRVQEKVRRIHSVDLFKEVVNLFIGHRRKMLKSCVRLAQNRLAAVHDWGDIFARAFVEPHHRGEELSADDYIALANLCHESLL